MTRDLDVTGTLSVDDHLPSEGSIGCLQGSPISERVKWVLQLSLAATKRVLGQEMTSGWSADGDRLPVGLW